MEKLVLSCSGGETSAYMVWWALSNWSDRYEMKVVFANTGKEREETLNFVEQCSTVLGFNTIWVESVHNMQHGIGVCANIVSFETASRNGEPFEGMIKKHGIPNIATPLCSRQLKARAIQAYLRSIGWSKYYTAIGIRADEFDRMAPDRKAKRLIYPLVTLGITKRDISLFWEKQPFRLQLQAYEGNCDLCFKKSRPKLEAVCSKRPDLANWWRTMEDRYGNYIPEFRGKNGNIKLPMRFYRDRRSIDDFFVRKSEYTQLDLFEYGCAESCEAF